jgi:hypothetical protein
VGFEGGVSQKKKKIAKKQHKQDKQHKQQSSNSSSSTIREKWNTFIASDSPAAEVPGARASRYRVYGVIGLHIGNYPEKKKKSRGCPSNACRAALASSHVPLLLV